MFRRFPPLLIAGSVLFSTGTGCAGSGPAGGELKLPAEFERLLPLHRKLGPPQPGDWLDRHQEPGQTYSEYVRGRPIKPTEKRGVIYVQPLGDFSRTQRKIIDLTAQFMGAYFELPVKVRPGTPLKVIPQKARRTHPVWGDKQILSTYVLDEVLRPRLPEDAAVYIAFTPSDLWPGEGWNFVFGQASLRQRVGVWSIYRNGDPDGSEAAFRLCLLRTIKTATHETGHMFSMMHCTLFECNMCGSNHRAESDRRPLALCPHCLAKLCHATGADPAGRFQKLIELCKKSGLRSSRESYQKSLAAIRAK